MEDAASEHAEDEDAAVLSSKRHRGGAQVPLAKYPVGKATQGQVLRDPELFAKTLREIHEGFGSQLRVPIVAGSELDLHLLYKQVSAAGGLQNVLSRKLWPEVCQPFNFPPTFTSRSWTLRRLYCQLLWHYEQVYLHRNRGPLVEPPFVEPPPKAGSSGRGGGRGRSKGRGGRGEGPAGQAAKRRRLGAEGQARGGADLGEEGLPPSPTQQQQLPTQPMVQPQEQQQAPGQPAHPDRAAPAAALPGTNAQGVPAAATGEPLALAAGGPGPSHPRLPAAASQAMPVQALVPGPRGLRRVLAVRVCPNDQAALAAAAAGAPLAVIQAPRPSVPGGSPPPQTAAVRGNSARLTLAPAAVAAAPAPIELAGGDTLGPAGAASHQLLAPLTDAAGLDVQDELQGDEGLGFDDVTDGGHPPEPPDADERSSGTMSGGLGLHRSAAGGPSPPRHTNLQPPPQAPLLPMPPAPPPRPPPRRSHQERHPQAGHPPPEHQPQQRACRPPAAPQQAQGQGQAQAQPPQQLSYLVQSHRPQAEPHHPALVAMGEPQSAARGGAKRPAPGTSFTGTVESVFEFGLFVSISLCGQHYRGVLYNPPSSSPLPPPPSRSAPAPPQAHTALAATSLPHAEVADARPSDSADRPGIHPSSLLPDARPRAPLTRGRSGAGSGAQDVAAAVPDAGDLFSGAHGDQPVMVAGHRLQAPGAAGPPPFPSRTGPHRPCTAATEAERSALPLAAVQGTAGATSAGAQPLFQAPPGGQAPARLCERVSLGGADGALDAQLTAEGAEQSALQAAAAAHGAARAAGLRHRRGDRRGLSPRRAPQPSPSARSAVGGGSSRHFQPSAGRGAAGAACDQSELQLPGQQQEEAVGQAGLRPAAGMGAAAQDAGSGDVGPAGVAEAPVEHVGETDGDADAAACFGIEIGAAGGGGFAPVLPAQLQQQHHAAMATSGTGLPSPRLRPPAAFIAAHGQPQWQQQPQRQPAAQPQQTAAPAFTGQPYQLPAGAAATGRALAAPLPAFELPRTSQCAPRPQERDPGRCSPTSPGDAVEAQGPPPGLPAWSPDASVCGAPAPPQHPHWQGLPPSRGTEASQQQELLLEQERRRTCESAVYASNGIWAAEQQAQQAQQQPHAHHANGACLQAGNECNWYPAVSHQLPHAGVYGPVNAPGMVPTGVVAGGTGGGGAAAGRSHTGFPQMQAHLQQGLVNGLFHGATMVPLASTSHLPHVPWPQALEQQHQARALPPLHNAAAQAQQHTVQLQAQAQPPHNALPVQPSLHPGQPHDGVLHQHSAHGGGSHTVAAALGAGGYDGITAGAYLSGTAAAAAPAAAAVDGYSGCQYVQDKSAEAEAAPPGSVYCYVEQDGCMVQQALDIHPDMLQHLRHLAEAQGGPVALELEVPVPLLQGQLPMAPAQGLGPEAGL